MDSVTVDRKQNIVDVCLQVYGTTQLLFDFAKDNGLNIDSDVNYGDVLLYDNSLGDLIVKNKIQRDNLKMINPASPDLAVLDGIGAWIIESTFIVQ